MSRADRGPDQPRAMIHRRILDVAESNPDASLAAIAEEVSGASPDLVDRVLDEYGDPGREPDQNAADGEPMDTTNAPESDTAPPNENEQAVEDDADDGGASEQRVDDGSVPELSEKQRRTLRALYERPEASQGDLAEELDVTRATVSRRLNAIPGFEWSDRRAFAESVFGEGDDSESEPAAESASIPAAQASTDGGSARAEAADSDSGPSVDGDEGAGETADGESSGVDPAALDAVESTLADLEDRLAAVECRADDADAGGDGPALSPELAHKVVHACMESDRLTEDEELEVLRALMDG